MKQHTLTDPPHGPAAAGRADAGAGRLRTTQLDEPDGRTGGVAQAGGRDGGGSAGLCRGLRCARARRRSRRWLRSTAGQGAAGAAAVEAAPSQRIVYFDFDSFAIKNEFNAMLDGHACALAASRDKRMGGRGSDTDETRQPRITTRPWAEARRSSGTLAVPAARSGAEQQLEAVRFGEERSAVPGSDEEACSRNRRAELKDR
ncbi:MAG: hypothetical protein IPJ42_16210 [Betaproteobacteria bacterium]|nr:hypothetical protein [Betaproteobacteria bacterium]